MWAQRTGDDRDKAILVHRLRVAFWSLLFLGLVGAFIRYVYWRPVGTPLLAAAVTDYPLPLPPNAWAVEDLNGLHALDSTGPSAQGQLTEARVVRFTEVPWEPKQAWVQELRKQFQTAQPGGPEKNAILLFISAHGVVDGQGEPCLIPPGASPWNSREWLRVRDLLKELFPKDENGNFTGNARHAHKLLILDCNRMDSHWGLGLLHNSFADRLPAVLREANVPQLYLLNSTSPGQVAWAAPELGGSVFGYFLAQGLRGAADVQANGNFDQRVSLRELHAYLKDYVGQWVVQNRADVQEPLLLPEDAPDVPLVFRHSDEGTRFPGPPEKDERWSRIAKFWLTHAELRAKEAFRGTPLPWEDFQGQLLRAEQLLQAGSGYRKDFDLACLKLESLAPTLDGRASHPELPAYSLPLASQWGKLPSSQELQKLPAPWKSDAAGAPAGAGEKPIDPGRPAEKAGANAPGASKGPDNAKDDSAKKPGEKSSPSADKPSPAAVPAPLPPVSYWAAAAEVWSRAADHHARHDLETLLQFADRADKRPAADTVELHFLRMLLTYLDMPVWDQPDLLKQALAVRRLAEEAAAPADAGVRAWVQRQVDQADEQRRLAEDALFVGSAAECNRAEQMGEVLAGEDGKSGLYGEAIARGREISLALQLRDRAWAEEPFVAQWCLARIPAGTPDLQELRDLLESTRRLGAILAEPPADGTVPAELPQLIRRVRDALDHLVRDGIDKECKRALEGGASDIDLVRRIGSLLSVPLVTGEQRNRLRSKFLKIVQDRAETAFELSKGENRDRFSGAGANWLARLAAWGEHPALMILDRTAVDGPAALPKPEWSKDSLERLAAQGEEVRRRLESVPDDALRWHQETITALARKSAGTSARAGCENAQRVLRAAAPLISGSLLAQVQFDPFAELRRLYLRELLAWHARRAMRDFWGPKSGAEQPYFEIVAHEYLQAAGKLGGAADLPETAALEGLIHAAENVFQPVVDPNNKSVSKLGEQFAQKLSLNPAQGLPPGEAAAYLSFSRGALPVRVSDSGMPIRRMPVRLEKPGPLEYLVSSQWNAGSEWRATALYRGHVREARFNVWPLVGTEITYKYQTPAPTSVTVYGETRQASAIMFVFDCSGSMGYHIVPNDTGTPTRLEAARSALYEALTLLAEAGEACRVGMAIYGHRVGTSDGKVVVRDPNDPNHLISPESLNPPRPELVGLDPDNDVEVLPLRGGALGPTTQARITQIRETLDKLYNLGHTPLYLGVMRAIATLNENPDAAVRRVVVITDGINDQLENSPHRKFAWQLKNLLDEPQNKNIHLDIVGLQVDRNTLESRELPEYDAMVKLIDQLRLEGRGELYNVNDHDQLIAALRRSLLLSKYTVARLVGDGSTRPLGDPLELNKTCRVNPFISGVYQVTAGDGPNRPALKVPLQGGEGLELYLLDSGKRLAFKRYQADLRDSCGQIPDPRKPDHATWIGAHLPKREPGGVVFYVSVQNEAAEEFSPRPQEAWVEITPMPAPSSADEPRKYVFYDPNFEPGRPVPVLRCFVPRWPRESREAEIEAWCKFTTSPTEEITVGHLRQYKEFRLADAPEVAFEVEIPRAEGPESQRQVIVTERHPLDADLWTVKIDLDAGAAGPVEVHRLFDPHAGQFAIVQHTFFLEGAPSPLEIDHHVLRLTSRKRLLQEAVAPPRKLHVVIPD